MDIVKEIIYSPFSWNCDSEKERARYKTLNLKNLEIVGESEVDYLAFYNKDGAEACIGLIDKETHALHCIVQNVIYYFHVNVKDELFDYIFVKMGEYEKKHNIKFNCFCF